MAEWLNKAACFVFHCVFSHYSTLLISLIHTSTGDFQAIFKGLSSLCPSFHFRPILSFVFLITGSPCLASVAIRRPPGAPVPYNLFAHCSRCRPDKTLLYIARYLYHFAQTSLFLINLKVLLKICIQYTNRRGVKVEQKYDVWFYPSQTPSSVFPQ